MLLIVGICTALVHYNKVIDVNNYNDVAACSGGSVTCKTYTQVLLDGRVQLRYEWKFTPNTGETYGPYTSYQL